MSPFFMRAMASAATLPTQSSAKATGRLTISETAAATGLSENSSFRVPFGRPKWASRMTLPPLSASSSIVPLTRSMRVVSVTRPFSVGTLRSTRKRTRLPETTASSSVRKALGMVIPPDVRSFLRAGFPPPESFRRLAKVKGAAKYSDELRHRHRRVGHAQREAPFVVVPGEHAHKIPVDDFGLVEVKDPRMRVVVEVDRDIWLVGVTEDALKRPVAVGGRLDGGVDLVLVGRPLGDELEIDNRDVRRRHADRRAIELALKLGQNEAHGLGRPSRGRNHRKRCGARAVEVLVQRVERRLIAGVGVDGRHEAVLDADRVVEHFRNRREAVRRAGGVRDDKVILGQLGVVHAVDDGQVGAIGRRGDKHALRARLQQQRRLVARGELAGALHRDVDAEILVREFGRLLDRGDLHLVALDDHHIAVDLHLVREPPMHTVEAQEMGVGLHRPQIIDGHNLNVLAAGLYDRAQNKPPDAAKAVDRYLRDHFQSPPHAAELMPCALAQMTLLEVGSFMPLRRRKVYSSEGLCDNSPSALAQAPNRFNAASATASGVIPKN